MIPSFLDDAIGFNIYRVELLFRKEFLHALAEYKITPEQWSIMSILLNNEKPLKQIDIVQLSLKDKHSVSRIIQRLERDGWIKKIADPHDARITIIRPTIKGKSLKKDVPQKLSSHFSSILKEFNDDEMESLLNLLKKLRQIFGDC